MTEHFGLAPMKTEGATVPFDREVTGPNPIEPTIEPDTAVHRLAFALCDTLDGDWPYETPYRCISLAERLIAKGLVFDPRALDATQRPNRGDLTCLTTGSKTRPPAIPAPSARLPKRDGLIKGDQDLSYSDLPRTLAPLQYRHHAPPRRTGRDVEGHAQVSKFRSKPVEIEAFQFIGPADLPDWFVGQMNRETWQGGADPHLRLETANGPVKALIGDWIIREPSGIGAYPCKPEVFAAKYEKIS